MSAGVLLALRARSGALQPALQFKELSSSLEASGRSAISCSAARILSSSHSPAVFSVQCLN